jgi:hypothetical protein
MDLPTSNVIGQMIARKWVLSEDICLKIYNYFTKIIAEIGRRKWRNRGKSRKQENRKQGNNMLIKISNYTIYNESKINEVNCTNHE